MIGWSEAVLESTHTGPTRLVTNIHLEAEHLLFIDTGWSSSRHKHSHFTGNNSFRLRKRRFRDFSGVKPCEGGQWVERATSGDNSWTIGVYQVKTQLNLLATLLHFWISQLASELLIDSSPADHLSRHLHAQFKSRRVIYLRTHVSWTINPFPARNENELARWTSNELLSRSFQHKQSRKLFSLAEKAKNSKKIF